MRTPYDENLVILVIHFKVNPRPCAAFYNVQRAGGGEGVGPPAVWFLIKLEAVRVALNERKPMVPNFKVSGQSVTSEIRSNTRSGSFEKTSSECYKADLNERALPE